MTCHSTRPLASSWAGTTESSRCLPKAAKVSVPSFGATLLIVPWCEVPEQVYDTFSKHAKAGAEKQAAWEKMWKAH